jgi:hypothetical protein
MAGVDRETLERALAWCAASGCPAAELSARAALDALAWDEVLSLRAALARERPRPGLGLGDLLALARGLPLPPAPRPPSPRAPSTRGQARGPPPSVAPRIRRARDRSADVPPVPAPLPLLETLLREEGRGALERLLRRHGASKPLLLRALQAGWRRADGSPPAPEDLDRLVAHHGLARVFAERERALLLHTLRRHGGIRPRAAAALGYDVAGLEASVDRLDAREPFEAIRLQARREVGRRATLADRVRLLVADEEALSDLGLLPEVEEDVRRRLPEHVRALRASSSPLPLPVALGRSLSLSRTAVDLLAARYGLAIHGAGPARPAKGSPRPGPRGSSPAARRPGRPAAAPRTSGPRRPAARQGRRPSTRRPL